MLKRRHISLPDARTPRPPPLATVVVVCRECPRLNAASELVRLIDAFADPAPRWTLVQACKRSPDGLLRLLQRFAASESKEIDPFLKHQSFSRAMAHAVHHGDLRVVQWLATEYHATGMIRHAARDAASLGRLEILQWLWTTQPSRMVWNCDDVERAAKSNHFEMVKWLLDSAPRPSEADYTEDYYLREVLYNAAENGNLDMVKWVDERRRTRAIRVLPDYVELAVIRAARKGHKDVMEYISSRFEHPLRQSCMNNAIRGCQWKTAKWLHAQAGISHTKALELVNPAARGRTEMIAWILENLELDQPEEIGSVIVSAAATGQLEVIKLLNETFEGPLSTDAMDRAAQHGQLETVKWLHENRTEGCTRDAMDRAAANGHLHVVQFLEANRSEGCSFNVMDGAAYNGHLHVVEWLHTNKKWCTANAMDGAASCGHLDVIQWLHEHRHEGCTVRAMENAAGNGHFEIVKWLHANRREGCTSGAMDKAAESGHLELVKWLDANRSEGCSTYALSAASRNGHVDMVKWLLANKADKIPHGALIPAAEGGNFEILWLLDKHLRHVYEPTLWLFKAAIRGRHYEVLEWLIREYADRTPELDEWLLRGIRVGGRTFDCYARNIAQVFVAQQQDKQLQ